MSSPSSPSSPGRQSPKTAAEHFNSTASQYERSTGGCTWELARDLLDLPDLQSITEIIRRCENEGTAVPEIAAVDAAENMVDLARAKFRDSRHAARLSFAAAPGESLDLFESESFTHSITNLGILFFSDEDEGAKEIYRTLAPGGVAVVTTWAELGYLTRVIHPAQRLIRPCDPVFKLPISAAWFQPDFVEEVMRRGGFGDVEMAERTVHYGAPDEEDLTQMLILSFQMLYHDWPEHEKKKFVKTVGNLVRKTSVPYTMPDGRDGMGIPMRAIVAVCRK
ncbi:unnamed protein product [Parascedosporium putredinis]|uniref:Methyltransferase type 11 domain-containing protein n=1 Tax=Parascedosporium putredinis TaxID=1442378 RepID=A0A9P1H1C5_9PEZI|nr:unnamed protein product [Parascedosporium putredinis]CAI7993609.1 unnamed protein product [Parascedosporium putredinis]